jgi:hypothetical protein
MRARPNSSQSPHHSLTRLGSPVSRYSRFGSSGAAACTTLLHNIVPGRSLAPVGSLGSSGGIDP